jgi:hypothetical protein
VNRAVLRLLLLPSLLARLRAGSAVEARRSAKCSNRRRSGRSVPKSWRLGCLRVRKRKRLLLALLGGVQRVVNCASGVSYRARKSVRTSDWS